MNSSRFGAVVVTYHPDSGFAARLATIRREIETVIVVDNSTRAQVQQQMAHICGHAGAIFLPNSQNFGLAHALNRGFTQLAQDGCDYAIAFDQDSTPATGFVPALLQTKAASRPLTAVVGANWYDEGRPGFPSRHLRPNPRWPLLFDRPPATSDLENVTCAITSGSLFDLRIWENLGGFTEGLFLDLVDTEYCLRARISGFHIAISAEARLAHRRGAKEPVRCAGRTWWPAFMPPFRLHYLWRNRVLVAVRHGWRLPHWIIFELVYAAKVVAEITLLEKEKRAKLTACARGTWDGLIGTEGPIS